jgi:hypothetical protein
VALSRYLEEWMHIVAIYDLKGSAEHLARNLSGVMGITPYEARARVMAPGGGPAVVGGFAEAAAAAACAQRLKVAGFSTLILDSVEAGGAASRFDAFQVRFGTDTLATIDRRSGSREFPYDRVTMLLRGTIFGSATDSDVTREKKFSPGLAILSGGLILRKTVQTVTQTVTSHSQPFLYLCTPEHPPVALYPEQMDFSTLGANRQLSREANFGWICAELRRRCSRAVWDDRLQTRPGQAQLLGPTLSPDSYLDLAITLLVQAAAASDPQAQ